MYQLTGRSFYDNIAQCTVAMIVNDMITVGALPLSVAMHLAVGDSNWFSDRQRSQDLINGWERACGLARCVWGGGETPTLKDVVMPGTVVLSGSAMGIVKPKERLITANIQPGDAIILLESSGIHANGLTLARQIAAKLPQGYLTKLNDGRTFGEALLDPTRIYVSIVEDCYELGVHIHYAVNITGHGWRKLMRATEPFVYLVEDIPTPQPVFTFMQEHGPIDDQEAYGNLNMGAGFALYVSMAEVRLVLQIAEGYGMKGRYAGHIEKQGELKKVVIQPKQLEFAGSSLGVR